jgi:hypothetical protein
MTDFAIYVTKKQTEQFDELFNNEIFEYVKNHGQGDDYSFEIFFEKITAIIPKITVIKSNHYDCDGKRGFAMNLTNKFKNKIKFFDDDSSLGIAIAPNGYLEKYRKYRKSLGNIDRGSINAIS